MARNGKTAGPEFLEGAVRIIEDLGTTVDEVERLGFRIVRHWSCALAVSERDAHALAQRQAMISRQQEAERRRREAEQAAKYPVPRGVPVVPGLSAFEQMLMVGEADRPPSAYEEMLDEALSRKGA